MRRRIGDPRSSRCDPALGPTKPRTLALHRRAADFRLGGEERCPSPACRRSTPRSWRSRPRPPTCTSAGRRSSSRPPTGSGPASRSSASTSHDGSRERRGTGRRCARCRSGSTPRSGSTTSTSTSPGTWSGRRSDRLAEVVDECMSKPLPRDRPLWQIWIADQLDDGRIGVVGKAHHCMVDGIAAVELGSAAARSRPRRRRRPSRTRGRRSRPRADSRLLARGHRRPRAQPARLGGDSRPRGALAAARRLGWRRGLAGRRRALARCGAPGPAAPRSSTRRSRRFGSSACCARPIDDLAQIKRAFDVKLNDVLLAASAGGRARVPRRSAARTRSASRRWSPSTSAGPARPDQLGNRISFMFVDLPCDEPDPVRRLREIHAATSDRKRAGKPEGADDVVRSLGFVPSPIQRVVSQLIASPRTFNLTVSNIPGPPRAALHARMHVSPRPTRWCRSPTATRSRSA